MVAQCLTHNSVLQRSGSRLCNKCSVATEDSWSILEQNGFMEWIIARLINCPVPKINLTAIVETTLPIKLARGTTRPLGSSSTNSFLKSKYLFTTPMSTAQTYQRFQFSPVRCRRFLPRNI